jgi:sugar phosphate isomerase/epimerase
LGLNGFASAERVHGLSFRLADILAHAHGLGYDGIELFPFHEPYPTTATGQQALRALYRGYGLATPALQSAVRGHAASPERSLRDAYAESIKAMLELAHTVEATVVGVWSGAPLSGVPAGEQMRWLLDTYQHCTALAEDAHITLALEPEPVQVVDSLEDLLFILNGVASLAFTAIFDFSHANVLSCGQPLEFLMALSGRIGHVHLTDNDGNILRSDVEGASHTSKHLAVGDGDLDMMSFVRGLREMGYSGWMQVDVWENPDPYRASRLGKQFLDTLR